MADPQLAKIRTTARVRLTADVACKKCDGRGVIVLSEYSTWKGSIEVSVKLCSCVSAAFVGKPRLPKAAITADLVTILDEGEDSNG